MITNYYNNPIKIQEFIWHSIKDLPQESVEEILNFVLFVRKKNIEPEMFNLDYEMLNLELEQKSIFETQHFEQEFENYKIEYEK